MSSPSIPLGTPPIGAGLWGRVRASERSVHYLTAGCTLVAGLGLLLLGTKGLDRLSDVWPRWVLGIAGLTLAFRGLSGLCRTRFGPNFQLGLWLAGLWVVTIIALAVFAPLLPFQAPTYIPTNAHYLLRPDLFSSHLLGTDSFGRDYLSRVIYGARISLFVGIGCTAIGLTVGTGIGILAGYYRGALEAVIRILTDSLLALPPLVFLLALVTFLRPSLKSIFIAFSILTVPSIIRIIRANTYQLVRREFVLAQEGLGASNARIIFREILPNLVHLLFAYSMIIIAGLIIGEASLSFLGLGIQVPTPSWGNMISEAQAIVQQYPHTLLVPSAILFLTVASFNRLGEYARARRETRQSVI